MMEQPLSLVRELLHLGRSEGVGTETQNSNHNSVAVLATTEVARWATISVLLRLQFVCI